MAFNMDPKTSGSVKNPEKDLLPQGQEDNDEPPPPYSIHSASSSSVSLTSSLCSSSSTSSIDQKSLGELQSRALEQHPTTASSSQGLLKPIAIPATIPKLGSAFLRAYPPSLESFSIPKDVFLHFLDDLNRVAVVSPPLQVLGLAGTIVSFVPIHEAQLVGTIVSNVAGITAKVISKGRTEMHIRKANKEIFNPCGLKVEIAKLNALAKLSGMPILNAKGKVNKKSAVLGPIEDSEAIKSLTGQERRLRALEPWIAPLDLGCLPEIEVPRNPLSKLNVGASEWQRKRGEKRVDNSLDKALDRREKKENKAEERHERKLMKIESKLEKAEREGKSDKAEKQLAKLERKTEKVDRKYEKKTSKIERKRGRDKKEERRMRKILWLIIRNVDADSGPGDDPYTGQVEEPNDDNNA